MPPHCDSLDGPVVLAASRALDAADLSVILPFVHADGEAEVTAAFNRVLPLHGQGAAGEVADLYFFETVVRVHRAGEGAPFTGLKPAGLDVGPVIPLAEAAIEFGRLDALMALLTGNLHTEVASRFDHLMRLKSGPRDSVAAERTYISAMLAFEVWTNGLYQALHAAAHEPRED